MAEDAPGGIVGLILTHCMSQKGAAAPIDVKVKTAVGLHAIKSRLISTYRWFQNLRSGSKARRQADRESAAYMGM
jgi:hypothetical protein